MSLVCAWLAEAGFWSLFWGGLTLSAVADILVLAFLIYQLLLLIRGTRATQMILGIGLIVFLYYASAWGNLLTLHKLLTSLLPYFVFALIVLFQSEIRRGLARLGRKTSPRRLTSLGGGPSYDDVLLAAHYFSAHKIGALVVIERDIGLRTYIESGIGLDAQISYDLLVTIFRPATPLHDGAVILQKDRVAAAACFLPLSVNPKLSTQFGTRHRAALGITEETDAIVLVVSEQSGAVSLAVAGQMEQAISLERLRVRLGELTGSAISPSLLPSSRLASESQALAANMNDGSSETGRTSRRA